jgi:hypothetical protein
MTCGHLCDLPRRPPLELKGALWRCPQCGVIYRAVEVWADMSHVYLNCHWERAGMLRSLWARLFRQRELNCYRSQR